MQCIQGHGLHFSFLEMQCHALPDNLNLITATYTSVIFTASSWCLDNCHEENGANVAAFPAGRNLLFVGDC